MVRKILAVLAGLIATSLAVMIVQQLGHYLYPLPPGTDPNDIEAIKKYVETAPFMAKFFVIISYAVGALTGGFVSTKIARDSSRAPAFIVGSIFLLISIYMMFTIPSPIWFWVLGVAAWGLVLVGYQLALKKSM
ncbi:MAG: hypothetical protein K0M56_05855 [Kaistella sp.]|nr:hypothetical protein [Kaistella sp.]